MAAAPAAGERRHKTMDAARRSPGPSAKADRTPLPRGKSATARPVIEGVRPQVERGRYPAKATLGEPVLVEADVFCDGHGRLAVQLQHRPEDGGRWENEVMRPLGNDRWRGAFEVQALGRHLFRLRAAVDPFASWQHDLRARWLADQELGVELEVGSAMLAQAIRRAAGADRGLLETAAGLLDHAGLEAEADPGLVAALAAAVPFDPHFSDAERPGFGRLVADLVTGSALAALVARYRPWRAAATSPVLGVRVDPSRARFSAWYEMFPRSASPASGRHGTFADVEARLDYVAEMGFDVLYLPPVHPIGETARKGPDGAPRAGPEDPGSPWAVGSAEGGHTALHPALGTPAEFEHLVVAAAERGIAVALDLAFQCSPDHPWVSDHPEWFAHRPDGSIRYAENPPKRYEDIYPLDFDTPDWPGLWQELLSVVEHWIARGVSVFRVDNPHTKPFAFWEWLLGAVKDRHPEVVFLSEAFTRPRVLERLAKVGFSQSYTYFAWRHRPDELEAYLSELVHSEVADFLRPNLWPNTPDILTEELQHGGPSAFVARLVLAATLSASYGIYGPPFELQEHVARSAGSEEYRHSEKYELRHWDIGRPDSLAELIARVNRIRRENPALHHNRSLRFHYVDNPHLLAYSKTWLVEEPHHYGRPPAHPPSDPNAVLVVVNVHRAPESGWVRLNLPVLGLEPGEHFDVHDLLTDAHYHWWGDVNYVHLDPAVVPAHILRIHRDPEWAAR